MELKKFFRRLYVRIKFEVYCERFYRKRERGEKDWIEFLSELKNAREEIGDRAYRIVEKYNTKRRLNWLRKRKKEIEEFKNLEPYEAIKKFFYEEYLGCKFEGCDKDSALLKIERNGNLTILHVICGNNCPILYYSSKMGIDPLPICKKAYESGAEAFLSELMKICYGKKFEVIYTRNYEQLRPRGLFCHEIVILKEDPRDDSRCNKAILYSKLLSETSPNSSNFIPKPHSF